MSHKTHPAKYLTLFLCAATCLGGGYLFITNSPSPPPETATFSSSSAPRASDSPLDPSQALTLCQNILKKGDPAQVSQFLTHFSQLDPATQAQLRSQLKDALSKAPELYAPFTESLALGLYRQNPENSLLFIAPLSTIPAGESVQRQLLVHFLEDHPLELRTYLKKHLNKDDQTLATQLKQLASIYADEQQEQLGDFMSWLSALDLEADWNLLRGSYQALAKHTAPHQRKQFLDQVLPSVFTTQNLWDIPSILVAVQSHENPHAAVETVQNLPTGPWKKEALGALLTTLGTHNPAIGFEVLSDPNFLVPFFHRRVLQEGPDQEPEDPQTWARSEKNFHDLTLESIVVKAIESQPELVLAVVDSFLDPQTTEFYRKAATGVLNGEPLDPAITAENQAGCSCSH